MVPTIITVVLICVLICVLIAALPIWKYSKPFGYTPTIWVGAMLGAHFYSVLSAA